LGLIMLLGGFVSTFWFPRLLDPDYAWTLFLYIGTLVAVGSLISRYWDFLRSMRLWISFLVLVLLNGLLGFLFASYLRALSLRLIGLMLAFELVLVMLFLDWFLDKKGKKKRHHPLTDYVAPKR
jgi:uncharacterized membrane protein YfcA